MNLKRIILAAAIGLQLASGAAAQTQYVVPYVADRPRLCDTVSDLASVRALRDGDIIVTKGRDSENDGLAAIYYYDAGSSATATGDAVVNGPGGTGRFIAIAGPVCGSIDSNSSWQTNAVTIAGAGGTNANPNKIGEASGLPTGTDYTKPAAWAADSGYVAGSANVATISGGYDHINNQLAGTIAGGGHNFIKYNVNGHSVICGGSYNLINQGRGAIVAGTNNAILGTADFFSVVGGGTENWITDASYGIIVGGQTNTLAGDHTFIGGGATNDIGTGSTYSAIVGGQSNTIADSVTFVNIAGGQSNTAAGTYCAIAGGRSNSTTANGDYSTVLGGRDCVINSAYATASGYAANTVADYSHTIGGTALNESGDAQSFDTVLAIRTSDATLTNSTQPIDLPDDRVTVGTMKIKVIAVKDGSADGNNDADYAQGSWSAEMGFYWDGTNGYLYDSSGATAKTASPTRDIAVIRDDITVGALPHIAINTGKLRVKVTGVAATTINWVAEIEAVMTRVD